MVRMGVVSGGTGERRKSLASPCLSMLLRVMESLCPWTFELWIELAGLETAAARLLRHG